MPLWLGELERQKAGNSHFPTGVSIKGSWRDRLPFLNARPMRRLGVSCRDLFFELDRPAPKPLPGEPYENAEWRVREAGIPFRYRWALLFDAASAGLRATRRSHHGSDHRAVPPGRACRPAWLRIKRGHYTAAKECCHGYRKRRASREGMEAIVQACMVGFGIAIASIAPVTWGWKIALLLAIMLLVGIIIPAMWRARQNPKSVTEQEDLA
jgi:hypothetical protein